MTILSRQMGFPTAGGASWQPGQGPVWRGGTADGWWHPKAVLAADPLNARAMRQGNEWPQTAVLQTARSSSHSLADASGLLRSFGVNTLAAIKGVGAYIGGQVTSLPLFSEAMDNAGWTKNGLLSVAVDSGLAPDGTLSADALIESAASGGHDISQTVSTSGTVVASVFVKNNVGSRWVVLFIADPVSGARAYVHFQPSTGTVGVSRADNGASVLYRAGAVAHANGFYRLYVIGSVPGATSYTAMLRLKTANDGTSGYAGDGSSSISAWGLNLTPANYLGPYIPTSGSSATRYASDVTAVPAGSDPFGGFSSSGLGAGLSVLAAVNLSHVGDGVVRPVAEMSDGTSSNRLRFFIDTDDKPAVAVVSGGSTLATAKLASALTTGRHVVAANYDPANGLYLVRKTGLEEASASLSGMPPGLTAMRLGSSVGGNYLNDVVEQIQIARPLTRAEAKAWVQAA